MPDWKQEVRKRLPSRGLSPAREAEIVDELAQDLSDRYQEQRAEGASEEGAYRALIAELDSGQLSEDLVRACGRYTEPVSAGGGGSGSLWASFARDLKYAARALRASPGFTTVAVLSLALGIGANTAIFQLIDAVRLRALPVPHPEQLAIVKIANRDWAQGRFNGNNPMLTNPQWEQIRDHQQAFSGIFVFGDETFNMADGGEVRKARGLWLSGEAFQVLGINAAAGRLLIPSDDRRGCGTPAAVLSYPFWQRQFGGQTSAIGRTLNLEGHQVEIVGVTPPNFFGLNTGKSFDVAIPLCADGVLHDADNRRLDNTYYWWLSTLGRLKPGMTLESANAQMAAISPTVFGATIPTKYNQENAKKYVQYRLGTFPGASGISNLREEYADPLYLLLAVAALVLLIACANLANLLLARASAREHEIAVRLALGASRGRLIRQLMTESLLLSVTGALIGLSFAGTVSAFLLNYISTEVDPVFIQLALDWRMFGFTAGLAILTCLMFGLAPAIRATRLSPQSVMTASGRGLTANRERFGMRRMLVVSQVALSLVLLVGALLFVRSLTKLMAVDAGFKTDGVVIASLDMSRLNTPMEARNEYQRQVLERVRATPGLQDTAMTSISPMSGSGWNQNIIVNGEKLKSSYMSRVTPGYFKALGVAMLNGRDFTERDNTTSRAVAIVNERFVQKYLTGQNPLGRTFQIEMPPGEPQPEYEIVGLVKDTKYYELREDDLPIVFFPEAQDPKPDPWVEMVVHSDLPLQDVTARVKNTLTEINPGIAFEFHVLQTQIHDGLLRERLMATLSGFFGFLAVVLAMVGLYGVISYMVVSRTNEIGIRMALGADRGKILSMIMREAGTLVAVGIVFGGVAAVIAARAASALLFGLKPHDPATLLIAAITLTTVGAVASLLPAQRAAKLDPMEALRQE